MLGGIFSVTYPAYLDISLLLRLPFTQEAPSFKIPLTQWFIKGLLHVGFIGGTVLFCKYGRHFCKVLNEYLRSFFNSKKYLSSKVEAQSLKSRAVPKNDRYYAVIYGANNRAGKAYAYFLLEKGFNLILIESDMSSHRGDSPLDDLQGDLLAQAAESKFAADVQVIKLLKFDFESVNNSLAHVIESKIKIFINCTNTKRSPKSRKNAQDSDQLPISSAKDAKVSEIQSVEDALSKEEVFFTGRRNIEASASIISVLLPRLIASSLNPAIINVDDDIKFDEEALRPGQLFFLSSIQFKDRFT